MTNPSPKPQARRMTTHLRSVSFSDDEQRVVPSSSIKRLYHSLNQHFSLKRNRVIHTPSSILKHKRNILNSLPNTPIQSSPKLRIGNQGLSMV
jgi:hypothetical protein